MTGPADPPCPLYPCAPMSDSEGPYTPRESNVEMLRRILAQWSGSTQPADGNPPPPMSELISVVTTAMKSCEDAHSDVEALQTALVDAYIRLRSLGEYIDGLPFYEDLEDRIGEFRALPDITDVLDDGVYADGPDEDDELSSADLRYLDDDPDA